MWALRKLGVRQILAPCAVGGLRPELGPGSVVAYERNRETNARLRDAGIEVVAISGSELGTGRGGPRCMSCPVWRDAP